MEHFQVIMKHSKKVMILICSSIIGDRSTITILSNRTSIQLPWIITGEKKGIKLEVYDET